MEYRYWLAAIPSIALGVVLGVYCLILVRLSRRRARLREEEANLRKRIADHNAA
jgi:hypothetical protein